jgi:MSHA biogenesis protein MshJ
VSAKIDEIQAQLNKLKPLLVTKDQMAAISREILKLKSNAINLTGVDKLPAIPWEPINIDQSDLLNMATGDVYVYAFNIQFESDYFNTLEFIKQVEKIPWPIYWDRLDYKVSEYPKANVILKIHLLSTDKE